MQGWGMNQNNGPTVDFKELLEQNKSVVKLLEVENLVEEVKSYSNSFTTQYLPLHSGSFASRTVPCLCN